MTKSADKVSRDCGRNPLGWREFLPMTLSLPLSIFAILTAGSFASWAKIVTAHHALHYVMGSKTQELWPQMNAYIDGCIVSALLEMHSWEAS